MPRTTLLIFLGVVTFIILILELIRFRNSSINRWVFLHFSALLRDAEISRLTGTSYLLIASLVAFLAFPKEIAVASLSFLAVGDAVADMVGKKLGKRKLFDKTLEGTLACLASCIAVGFALHYTVTDIRLPVILTGALVATAVEAVPLPINDNLTMPLSAGVVMMLMQL